MKHRRQLFSLLAIVGLAAPLYARFEGAAGGGSGGASGGAPGGAAGDKGGSGESGAAGGEEKKGEESKEGGDGEQPVVAKKAYDAVLADLHKFKNQIAELNKKIANAPSEEEVRELREARVRKQQEEEEAKKKAGQYEEIIAKQKRDAAEALAAEKAAKSKVESKYANSMVVNALAAEIPNYTTAPVSDVLSLIQKHVSFDLETEKFKIDVDGVWPVNDKGREMTIAEFVESQITKRPYLAMAKPAQGSGGTSQRGKGTDKNQPTDAQVSRMSDKEFKEYEQTYLAKS